MKISLLTTGGTIASVESDRGLQPGLAGEQLLRVCPGLMDCKGRVGGFISQM